MCGGERSILVDDLQGVGRVLRVSKRGTNIRLLLRFGASSSRGSLVRGTTGRNIEICNLSRCYMGRGRNGAKGTIVLLNCTGVGRRGVHTTIRLLYGT